MLIELKYNLQLANFTAFLRATIHNIIKNIC